MGKVDKEQLRIYQWAAEEFFQEKVADLQYWFLRNGLDKMSFLGKPEELKKLKEELKGTIDEIVACIKNNSFLAADLRLSHDCSYRDLEKGMNINMPAAGGEKRAP